MLLLEHLSGNAGHKRGAEAQNGANHEDNINTQHVDQPRGTED